MRCNGVVISAFYRSLVATMACLATISAVKADQWDDLVQKFIDQERAQFVRRAADQEGIVIVLAHPLISERLVLTVTKERPAMSFQFSSSALPGDDAFELMARGGHLITGKDTAAIMRDLRRAHLQAGKEVYGVGFVVADGLAISCVSPRDSNTLSFLLAGD
jgi:hypothetical protein